MLKIIAQHKWNKFQQPNVLMALTLSLNYRSRTARYLRLATGTRSSLQRASQVTCEQNCVQWSCVSMLQVLSRIANPSGFRLLMCWLHEVSSKCNRNGQALSCVKSSTSATICDSARTTLLLFTFLRSLIQKFNNFHKIKTMKQVADGLFIQ